jgi:PAS domain S-box-containing protein
MTAARYRWGGRSLLIALLLGVVWLEPWWPGAAGAPPDTAAGARGAGTAGQASVTASGSTGPILLALLLAAGAGLLLGRTLTVRRLGARLASTDADLAASRDAYEGSERRYSTVFNSVNDALVIHDRDGRLLDVNDTMLELFGTTRDRVLGRRFADDLGVPDDDAAKLREVWGDVVAGQHHHTFAWDGRKVSDGSRLHLELSLSPIRLGSTDLVLASMRDVTEHTRADEERRHMQEQLARAQKLEAIGTLAGGIAHDFNNVLGAIIGNAELAVMDAATGAPVQENLREILTAAQRARDLVRQILAFARQAAQTRAPVKVATVAREVAKFMRASLPATIEIRQRLSSTDVVLCDSTHLHQVIMNLCTNAYRAMPDGGVISLSLDRMTVGPELAHEHPHVQPGDFVVLAVEDTGVGMTPEIVRRIFEPFFTTRAKEGGTGLGLAVVHGIVTQLGGFVTVTSEPAKGSTFQVYLPVAKETRAAESAGTTPAPKGSGRILLVDDEPALARAAQRILQRIGYEVTALTSSIDALDLFRERPNDWDVVVSDVAMPRLSGDRLVTELRAVRADLPVVLCTGYSERVGEQEARKLGIAGFLLKPYTQDVLAATVRDALAAARPKSG